MRKICRLSTVTLLALAACDLGTEPSRRVSYGLIGFSAIARSDGSYSTRPLGVFFRLPRMELPSSRATEDTCDLRPFNPGPSGGFGPAEYLNAGDAVTVQFGSSQGQMTPTIQGVATTYTIADTAGVIYTPGEQATFAVPGAPDGFPAASIAVRSAEPFTFGPVDPAPPAGQDLTLTWTPAGDDSSKMVVSLQYATPGEQAPDFNQQVLCSLFDDGSHTIPSIYVQSWRVSVNDLRQAEASRWRTSFRDLGDDTELWVQSTFDVVKTVFP